MTDPVRVKRNKMTDLFQGYGDKMTYVVRVMGIRWQVLPG